MVNSFTAEIWAEFAIVMVFISLRFYAKWIATGPRSIAIDDIFMALAMAFFTAQTACVHILSNNGALFGLNATTAELVPEAEAQARTYGAKVLFAAWFIYPSLIWSLKAVYLVILVKLTQQLPQQKYVQALIYLCVATWMGCIICNFTICVPVQHRWQVKPYPGDQCAETIKSYYVYSTFNVVTYMGIFLIPVRLLIQCQMPLKKKLAVIGFLLTGLFVIVAVVVRAVFATENIPQLLQAAAWVQREAFVGAIVVCIPKIRLMGKQMLAKWRASRPANPRTESVTELQERPSPQASWLSDTLTLSAGNEEIGTTTEIKGQYLKMPGSEDDKV